MKTQNLRQLGLYAANTTYAVRDAAAFPLWDGVVADPHKKHTAPHINQQFWPRHG